MMDCAIYIDYQNVRSPRMLYDHLIPFEPFIGGANWMFPARQLFLVYV